MASAITTACAAPPPPADPLGDLRRAMALISGLRDQPYRAAPVYLTRSSFDSYRAMLTYGAVSPAPTFRVTDFGSGA